MPMRHGVTSRLAIQCVSYYQKCAQKSTCMSIQFIGALKNRSAEAARLGMADAHPRVSSEYEVSTRVVDLRCAMSYKHLRKPDAAQGVLLQHTQCLAIPRTRQMTRSIRPAKSDATRGPNYGPRRAQDGCTFYDQAVPRARARYHCHDLRHCRRDCSRATEPASPRRLSADSRFHRQSSGPRVSRRD